jgi:ribokinase
MPSPRVIVIGSTNTDMVVQADTLPAPGQTVLGGAFRMTPGGKGANQAVAAARAGGVVTFLTAVGDDAFGHARLDEFRREGIDTQYMKITADALSGVALIVVDAHGENLIAVAPGANGLLTPAAVDAIDFHGVRMAILQLEIPLETVLRAAQRARGHGCPVLLNPAPMPPAGLPAALLAVVDILTPNEGEARALAPGAATLADAAREILDAGPRALVVTRGRHGVSVFTRDEQFDVPAIPVTAVDTVGAGDCCSAALGVAFAEGRPLRDAARFAVVAAGLSTTRVGAQAAMPMRAEIDAAIGS